VCGDERICEGGQNYDAYDALVIYYQKHLRNGSTTKILDRLMPFDDFNEIVGLDEKYSLDS
jgi:hypothetical protein